MKISKSKRSYIPCGKARETSLHKKNFFDKKPRKSSEHLQKAIT